MKKCIVIPDSFKGTMSSEEICGGIKGEILRFFPGCEVLMLPVADGGEGTVDCFLTAMDGKGEKSGESVIHETVGVFGEKMEAKYALFENGEMAVIEMAMTAGLPLAGDNKNPLTATTAGVGGQIRDALERGVKKIVLGLGGSATNDGGCGMAAALGVRFTDKDGNVFVPAGGTLSDIAGIDVSGARELLRGVEITAMCDIDNPMHGETGAAYIFGPQKGADAEMVKFLDRGLIHLDKMIRRDLGIDVSQIPGSGAAGGIGAGVCAFLGGTLKPGIEIVLDVLGFDNAVKNVDLVITGEGRIDSQSIRGKVVAGVSGRSKAAGVPVIAIVGDVGDGAEEMYNMGLTAIFSINRVAVPYEQAKKRAFSDLKDTAGDIMRLIKAVSV